MSRNENTKGSRLPGFDPSTNGGFMLWDPWAKHSQMRSGTQRLPIDDSVRDYLQVEQPQFGKYKGSDPATSDNKTSPLLQHFNLSGKSKDSSARGRYQGENRSIADAGWAGESGVVFQRNLRSKTQLTKPTSYTRVLPKDPLERM